MENRAAINEQMRVEKFFPPFFSVLMPELGRPQYLRKCLESVHQFADMPVEIIVHDDGSGEAKQRDLLELRSQISTLILNTGHNTGLAPSMNRCRALASSKYLFGFNTDTYLTSPVFKNVKAALDLPYVGIVNMIPQITPGPGVHITPEGVKIQLRNVMGACHAFGIRSEVWDSIGGWNPYVQTTSSDVGFMGSIFGAGLFSVLVEGTCYNEMWPNDGRINTGGTNHEYVSAADFTRDDMNVPLIFGMPKSQHDFLCRRRWEHIYDGVNVALRKDSHFSSWHNTNFIVQEMGKMFRNIAATDIDWEVAKTYGHAKWKDQIVRDFGLEG